MARKICFSILVVVIAASLMSSPFARVSRGQALPGSGLAAPRAEAGSASPAAPVCVARINDAPTDYATVQAAVDAAQPGDTVKVAGTCTGVEVRGGVTQTVYVDKSLTLRGGYTTTNWLTPAPAVYTTTLDAQRLGRVLYVTGDIDVTVTGLRITGGDTNGVGGGSYVQNATLTLSESTFISNTARYGGGIVLSFGNATIQNCIFEDNVGGGLAAETQRLFLWHNTFRHNDAQREGGAIYIFNSPYVVLKQNDISYNTATRGGCMDVMYSNVRLDTNTIKHNTATDREGGGVYLSHCRAEFTNNMLYNNHVISSTVDWGGGAVTLNDTHATFDRDWIVGNSSSRYGGGMVLFNSDAVIRNVLLARNSADVQGSGLYASGSRITMLHATVADNTGGDGSGIYVKPDVYPYIDVTQPSTTTVTNSIVAGQTVGVYAESGSTVTMDHTLWWNNGVSSGGGGTLVTTNNLAGDPAFEDAANNDYRIAAGSAALDVAANAGVRRDRDDQVRAMGAGYDVGCDERLDVGLDLDYHAVAPAANPGDSLNYTLVVTGAGTGTATGVHLTGTLGTAQRVTAVPSSHSCAIADGGWGGSFTCAPGDLAPGDRVDVTVVVEVAGTVTPWQQLDTTVTASANETQNTATATIYAQECEAVVAGGATYGTVQAAVDAAAPGGTVTVSGVCLGTVERGGTWQQARIEKNLTFRGSATLSPTLDALGQGRGLYVTGGADVTVEDLHVTGGDVHVHFEDGPGGGIFVKGATATLRNLEIEACRGYGGGGIGVTDSTVTLRGSRIHDNLAYYTTLEQTGGGGFGANDSEVHAYDNTIYRNTAHWSGRGGGVALSDITGQFNNNYVYDNLSTHLGGGLCLLGNQTLKVKENAIYDNTAVEGGGISFFNDSTTVEGNEIYANAAQSNGGGVSLAWGTPRFANNVLTRNHADNEGSAIFLYDTRPHLIHTTIADNTGGSALFASGANIQVTFTNTIISGHTQGISVSQGSTVTLANTLWWDNATNWSGNVLHTGDHAGDPAYVDAPGGDYHITAGSAALDRGRATDVATDIDGDPRTMGSAPDLGADEIYQSSPLSLTVLIGQEPGSLYLYDDSVTLAAQHVRQALMDGPIDSRTYDHQPVILERLPSLANGDAVTRAVTVNTGDTVVNDSGDVVALTAGTVVRPSGCTNSACAVTFTGAPLAMDQMAVTFTLKSGLLWSDGQPLTADDSVYSFEVAADPATPGSDHDMVDRTASYTAPDATTAVWVGVPGYRDREYALRFWTPLPRHQLEIQLGYSAADLLTASETVTSPLGWGPFRIHEWIAGDHITVVRNPFYWRAGEGMPYLDQITFRFVPAGDEAIARLTAGSAHVATRDVDLESQAQQLLDMEAMGTLNPTFTNGTAWEHVTFGIDPAGTYIRPDFFEDVRTRRAIAHCLDRQGAVDAELYGRANVPDAYLPAEHPLYPSGAISTYAYDPAQGQALLEAVGWRDDDHNGVREAHAIPGITDGTPLSFTWKSTDAEMRESYMASFREDLAACGITVTLETMPAGDFFADGPAGPVFGRQFDLASFAWTANADPRCDRYASDEIPSTANGWSGSNVAGFSDAAYDAACQQAREALPGTPAYTVGHQEALRIFSEQLPAIPLFQRLKLAAARPELEGFAPDPTEESELWNVETWMLSEAEGAHLIAILAFDNDLSPHAADVIERVRSGTAANPDVVATLLVDGAEDGDTRALAIANGTVTEANVPGLPAEADTADPAVLGDFLTWAREQHPDRRDVVALVGHGAGLAPEAHVSRQTQSIQSTLPALPRGHDFTPVDVNSGTYLSTPELGRALRAATANGTQPFDVVFFDQCFMGNLDTLYEVHDTADVFVASPNYAWAAFAYDDYIAAMTPSASDAELAQAIVAAYGDRLNASHPHSLFWMRGSDVAPVATDVDGLGDALRSALATPGAADQVLAATAASRFVDTTLCDEDLALCPPDEMVDLFSFALQLRTHFASGTPVHTAAGDVLAELGAVHVSGSSGHPWVEPERMWEVANVGLTVLAPLTPTLSPDVVWRASLYTHTVPLTAVWSPQPTRTVEITQPWAYPVAGRWDDFIAAWYAQGGGLTPTVGQWCHAMPPALVITGSETLSLAALPDTDDNVHLDWTPSVDPAVVDYALYVKGPGYLVYSVLAFTGQTIYEHLDLLPGTYTYFVAARDARGDVLARSPEVTVEVGVPFISAVNPNFGLNDAPTEIFIHGAYLTPLQDVYLNSTPLTVTYATDSLIIATIPAGLTPGWYDLEVEVATATALHPDAFEVVDATGVDDLRSSPDWIWSDPLVLRIGGAANSRVGLNVQRLGGTETLDQVEVAFQIDGSEIGRGQTQPLAPYGVEATTPVAWAPSAAGTYTLCAIIDPDDAAVESDETNNTICRDLVVLPPAQDTEPPVVDDFVIDDDALTTPVISATLDVTATDPGNYPSGVSHVKFAEFEYIWSARRWVPITLSKWIPYAQAHRDRPWTLLPTFGVRYMSAWAIDHAGNISLAPGEDYIDLYPQTQTGYVWQGGVDFYRFYLGIGQSLNAVLTSVEGDADLYVWGPDGALVAHSNQHGSSDDSAGFTASLQGTYQIEVHGYTSARYRLALTRTLQAKQHSETRGASAKIVPGAPAVPVDSWPAFYDLAPLPYQLSSAEAQTVPAGTPAIYTHTLQNTSAEALTVTVRAVNAEGWDVLLREGQTTTVNLPVPLNAGEVATFTVEVSVPASATPGIAGNTIVTATLASDPETYVTVTDVTHVAGGGYKIFLPLVLR